MWIHGSDSALRHSAAGRHAMIEAIGTLTSGKAIMEEAGDKPEGVIIAKKVSGSKDVSEARLS